MAATSRSHSSLNKWLLMNLKPFTGFKTVHAQTIMKLQLSYPLCIPFHSNITARLTEQLLLQAPVYKLSVQGPPDQHCPESSKSLSSNTLNLLNAALSQWPAWVWLPPKLKPPLLNWGRSLVTPFSSTYSSNYNFIHAASPWLSQVDFDKHILLDWFSYSSTAYKSIFHAMWYLALDKYSQSQHSPEHPNCTVLMAIFLLVFFFSTWFKNWNKVMTGNWIITPR